MDMDNFNNFFYELREDMQEMDLQLREAAEREEYLVKENQRLQQDNLLLNQIILGNPRKKTLYGRPDNNLNGQDTKA